MHFMTATSFDDLRSHAEAASNLMQALSNPNRLMILCALSQGELCVSDLNEQLQISQSALSQHLAVLRHQGLVSTRRQSQTIFYCVAAGPALDIVALLHQHFCGQP
jgi:DNA-binding transcriptional ArsR family regulator